MWLKPHAGRIRVTFLSPSLLLGGAERWVVSLARGLNSNRFQVLAIVLRDANSIHPAAELHVAGRCPILIGLNHVPELAHRSDVVIAWGLSDLSCLAGFKGIAVYVGHGHCPWTVEQLQPALPHVTHWAAVSRSAAQSFPDPSQVEVLHNGIDVDRCRATESRRRTHERWRMSTQQYAIGYVGRLSREKNPIAHVHACARLGVLFRPVLCGDGQHTQTFLRMAQRIRPDVIYQPAVDQVGNVYQALDCFCLVSPSEGMSLALLEAQYCRCPTVTTNVGAIEIEERTGPLSIHVPIDPTPDDLAHAILQALDPSFSIIREHAAKLVADHYTAAHMVSRWETYLTRIHEDRAATRPASALA